MINKNKTTNLKNLNCPLCGAVVKGVSDPDPGHNIRFYDDKARNLYAWYTKKRMSDVMDINRVNRQISFNQITEENKESEENEQIPNDTSELSINSLKNSKIKRSLTECYKENISIDSNNEGINRSVHNTVLNAESKERLHKYMTLNKPLQEITDTMENCSANCPKRFLVNRIVHLKSKFIYV